MDGFLIQQDKNNNIMKKVTISFVYPDDFREDDRYSVSFGMEGVSPKGTLGAIGHLGEHLKAMFKQFFRVAYGREMTEKEVKLILGECKQNPQ